MTTSKKLAALAIALLALGATACSSTADDSAASTTAPVTAASSSDKDKTTTTEDEDEKTTTTEDEEEPSRPRVTKPAKVEKIDKAELPEEVQSLPTGDLGFSADEEDCVYTVIYEYTSDSSNPQDDATLSGVLGGAIAACVDQDKLAALITDSVEAEAPEATAAQLSCIEEQIATADTESLGIFLGAFIYEGPGSADMQEEFLTALDEACNLSS